MTRSPAMSFSRSRALACPYYYTRIYVDGVQPPDSTAASSGRMFHEWIAKYVTHLVGTKQDTDWDWIDANPVGEIGYLIQLTRDYFVLSSLGYEPECEVRFALSGTGDHVDFESKDAVFRGVIDLLGVDAENAYIDDWKSGYAMKTESQLRKDKQLKWYAYDVSLEHPDIQMFHMKQRYPRYRFAAVGVTFSRDDLKGVPDEIRNKLKQATEIQLMDDPPARPCDMCTYCQLECPLKTDGLLIPPAMPTEALRLADALESLETQKASLTTTLERYREALAAYCGEHGEIENSAGVRYGHYPVKQFQLTDEATALLLVREPGLLAASASAVKTKLDSKKRADLRAELADCYVETTKTRFGNYKEGDGE